MVYCVVVLALLAVMAYWVVVLALLAVMVHLLTEATAKLVVAMAQWQWGWPHGSECIYTLWCKQEE